MNVFVSVFDGCDIIFSSSEEIPGQGDHLGGTFPVCPLRISFAFPHLSHLVEANCLGKVASCKLFEHLLFPIKCKLRN